MSRHVLAAFVLAALCFAPSFAANVSAQEAPRADSTSTPAPTETAAPKQKRIFPRQQALLLTLTPNYSWSLNPDDQPRHVANPENVKTTDDADLDGSIVYQVGKTSIYASKESLPLSLGSLMIHTPHATFPVYPGDGVDFLYQAGVQQQFTKHLDVGLEYRYRYRVCCAGDSDPTNTTPAGYGGPALNINLKYGPYTPARLVFGYNSELQAILDRNHPDPGLVLGPGIPYHGDQLVFVHNSLSVAALFNPKGIVPFFVYDHSADDYRSQAGPSYAHFFLYGVGHDFSRMADVKVMFIDLHQIRNSGLNTAAADTVHFSVFSLVFDFRWDLLHLGGKH